MERAAAKERQLEWRVQHVFQDQEIEAFLKAHGLALGELRGARVPRDRRLGHGVG